MFTETDIAEIKDQIEPQQMDELIASSLAGEPDRATDKRAQARSERRLHGALATLGSEASNRGSR